jgi:hypothetical protein
MRRLAGAWLVIPAVVAVVGLVNVWPGLFRFVHTNDQLHYAVHLTAGRILSLCDCTDHLAEAQYYRGLFHARTPEQVALLTTGRPVTAGQRVREVSALGAGALRWVQQALSDRALSDGPA